MSGFSPRRLERWRTGLTGYVERGSVPDLVALVDRDGEAHAVVAGSVGRDTPFRISSMTKPVVAAAAMVLVEECALRLDDPVDPWLPELADVPVLRSLTGPVTDTVALARPITARDLLTSTLGTGQLLAPPGTYPVQEALAEAGLAPGPPRPARMPAPEEYLRRVGGVPLLAQPGQSWFYDTSYDVLGVLVARVAGTSLGEFLADRLFGPLGMTATGFWAASGLPVARVGTEVFDAPDGQWAAPPPFESGAGGLVSTADDYLRFGRALLTGGGGVLSPASVALMSVPHVRPEQQTPGFLDWTSTGWGFGVAVTTARTDLAATPGRFGWDGGLGTSARVDPELGVTTVVLTQQLWTSPEGPALVRDADTLAYQALV
ncbi:serine hydrolase domain-containing protein [Actinokineospora bangkokensis]|uniref:Beta-lactamase-related domain-containing protein n=1 Tax=Actinokineospora bangkokensis TaxID=1193682 RepID=A0A1Q9LEW3_9PSEU|nr:serine hydrolase domain-containing protein [Actinokineospora bangkokensis]OLR90554.1 hypothetical protein BJP25_28425 [Actinokineospora bangkokensis]